MAEDLYSRAQIERWQENLLAISNKPRTTFTKKQAVEALIDTIEKALETRSFDEVAGGLKEWGLDISTGSLKQYVSRYRRQLKAGTASRKRTGRGDKADEGAGEKSGGKAEKSRSLGGTTQRHQTGVQKAVKKLAEPALESALADDPFEQLRGVKS